MLRSLHKLVNGGIFAGRCCVAALNSPVFVEQRHKKEGAVRYG
jgi:hypothetical protein